MYGREYYSEDNAGVASSHKGAQYRARIGKHAPGAVAALFLIAKREQEEGTFQKIWGKVGKWGGGT